MVPVVGITVREFAEYGGYKIRRANAAVIEDAGGLPLFLAPVHSESAIRQQLSLVDAVFLTGGGDPDPALFGQEQLPVPRAAEPERDTYELAVARIARRLGLPLLGVCRGMQMINIALGGSIHQDIAYCGISKVSHDQREDMAFPTHSVEIVHPRLAAILGGRELMVNSSHHQAVAKLAPGLVEAAHSPDGVTEAYVSADDSSFIFGIQWHPELQKPTCGIFRELVKYAEQVRSGGRNE